MTLYVKQGFIFRNDAYKNFSAGVWSNVDARWKPKSESIPKLKINFLYIPFKKIATLLLIS